MKLEQFASIEIEIDILRDIKETIEMLCTKYTEIHFKSCKYKAFDIKKDGIELLIEDTCGGIPYNFRELVSFYKFDSFKDLLSKELA